MSEPTAIRVYLNGDPRAIGARCSLPELLTSLDLPLPALLVECNGQALLRSEWDGTLLEDGDRLEILRVVAGG